MSDMKFGRYKVVNSLGRGGMAEVYRAYDPMLDRYVAVKVILPHLVAEEKFEERFFQEAKLVASLRHPNIVKILDFGIENDQPYMVMEYLDHGTLQDRIGQLSAEKRTMTLEEIEPILKQIANALDYAHQNGAIHRDIKPANILFSSRGEPVLTDFGIAKLFADTAHITVTGGIVGSPKYMSPEQAASEPVGKFSDIYSLGIVIYEMATGQTPFQGDSITGVLMQHLNTPPPPPRELNPNIPQPVQVAIIRALAKKPDERYDSAGDFANTFISTLHGETTAPVSPIAETIADDPTETAVLAQTIDDESPIEASPPPISPIAERPTLGTSLRRVPRNVLIAGLLVLVGVISIGGYLLFGDDLFAPDRRAETPDLAVTPTPAGGQSTTQSDGQEGDSQVLPAPSSPTPSVDVATAEQPVPPQNVAKDPQWTSWTAGNNLYSIEFWGDLVVAGGWGGVVFRDQVSGETWHFTTGDGLADSWVLSLFVDSDNTLWVGTYEGLHHFTVTGEEEAFYDMDDGLDSATVSAMIRYDDDLIAGSHYAEEDGGGLNIFDGSSWKLFEGFPSKYEEDPESLSVNVTSMVQDWEGGLWVGTTNGLAYFDGETWFEYNETNSELPDNYINVLYIDDDGNLWVGTNNGAAKFEEDTITSFTTLSDYTVLGIIQDQGGDYWFSGFGGIVHFNPDNGDWEYFNEDNINLGSYDFYEAAVSADGVLYFASEGAGLISYEDGDFTELSIPNLPSLASFDRILPYQDARLMFVEEGGSVADVIDPQTEAWMPLFDPPCCITPHLFDEDGNLWGVSDEGLWIMKSDGSTANWTTADGLPADQVTVVAFGPEDSLWVGTDSGVAVLDPDTMAVLAIHDSASAGFTDNQITALLHTSDGSMWVGTNQSLNRVTPDGSWEQFTYGNPFSDDLWAIADLGEDADGGLWITSYGDGVYYYTQAGWEHFDPERSGVNSPSYDVHSVTIAPNGDVWFGTDYSGAVLYREGQWQRFGIEDGLIHFNVNDIYVDAQGAVWFATSGGISRYTQSVTSLAEDAPWALFVNDEGIWSANMDGTALTNLFAGAVETPHDLQTLVAPDGAHLAFHTATDRYFETTLNVISLPDGEMVLQLPLTSPDTEPEPNALQGDPNLEIVRTFIEVESLAWSPDGQMLAFMGAHEGPSSDLYVYSIETGEITRLTDGPSQGIKPSWSLEGEYILHAGVSTLGTGAGYSMQGVWVAAADDTGVRRLYDPANGDETWLGWLDAHTVLVYSWSAACDAHHLRALDILTETSRSLWNGNFQSAAYDPDTGTVVLSVHESYPDCGIEGAQGLYLIEPQTEEAAQIAASEELALDFTSQITWSATQGKFLIGTEAGLFFADLAGDVSPLPGLAGALPLISPDGDTLAWTRTSTQVDTGVWVAEWEAEPRQIFSDGSAGALWTDNAHLLFLSSDGLYLATGPGFEPVLVQDGFRTSGMALVEP